MEASFFKRIPEQRRKRGKAVLNVLCWLSSLGVWGLIGYLTVYVYFLNYGNIKENEIEPFFLALVLVYFYYLILEFASLILRYMFYKRTNEGIKQKMQKIFVTRPEIIFHAECYHYEERTVSELDDDGCRTTRTKNVKVVTRTESEHFHYCSVRDVSGLLNLKCDKAQIKRKCYIKLQLKEEINFADAITIADYERQKTSFQDRMRGYDDHMDYSETKRLPGITHHNLIKFGEYDPCTVSCFWYFIFTIFTLGQFYKWHVSSFCVFQSYKIRKIMSSRYNLNSAEMDKKYRLFNPQINLVTLKIDYEPKDYTFYEPPSNLQIPTEAELELAKKYDAQVPKYEVYDNNCGDIYRCGTVKDNPDFHAYDYPPEAIPDGPISSNAINTQGNLPSYIPPSNPSPDQYNSAEQGYNSADQGYNSAAQGYNINAQGYDSAAQGGGINNQDINNQGGNLPNAGGVY